MGKHYQHLQAKDRIAIYEWLYKGFSIREIAKKVGCHYTTTYRESNRNSCHFGYRPDIAQQQYTLNLSNKPTKLDRNPTLKHAIISKLKRRWSPELIAGRLKYHAGQCVISHETIDCFI